MKKAVFFSFWLLTVLCMVAVMSNSCGNAPKQNENASKQEENVPKQEELSNIPENQNENAGVITGDVMYKGIELSRILDENPESTLGTPLSTRGQNYFYEGLEIYFTENVENIQLTDLSLFEVNGVSLNKNKAELIAAFGKPIQYFEYPDYVYRNSDDDRMIRYHVSCFIADYMLDFWFEETEDKAYICGVGRIGQ